MSFRVYAGFETGSEIDKSSIADETTNIYIQNPVCNGFYIVFEFNDLSQSG